MLNGSVCVQRGFARRRRRSEQLGADLRVRPDHAGPAATMAAEAGRIIAPAQAAGAERRGEPAQPLRPGAAGLVQLPGDPRHLGQARLGRVEPRAQFRDQLVALVRRLDIVARLGALRLQSVIDPEARLDGMG